MGGESRWRKMAQKVILPRAAKLISSEGISHPIGVSDGSAGWLQCYDTCRAYVEQHGGRVVYGFIVVGPFPRGARVAYFEHHAVVLTSDGVLVDPSYRPGRAPAFLPDPARPYDAVNGITWNILSVFREPYTCPMTQQRIPAWTMAATARVNEQTCYSIEPRHYQRRHFEDGDREGYKKYVSSLGLDPKNPVDACFTTNLEIIFVHPDDPTPPEFIKDFKRMDVSLVPPSGIRPFDEHQVTSEAENERIGRLRRDGP